MNLRLSLGAILAVAVLIENDIGIGLGVHQTAVTPAVFHNKKILSIIRTHLS